MDAWKVFSVRLTTKQQAWINEYLISWNATDAARKAGYKGNDATLAVVGHENLRKPNIAAEVQRRLNTMSMQADEVLARLTDHARGHTADFVTVDEHGAYQLDLKKAEERGKLHLIKKLKTTKYGLEIELHDSQSALQILARHHGLLKDVLEIDWKRQLKDQGLDPAEEFEKLVQHIASNIEPGTTEDAS